MMDYRDDFQKCNEYVKALEEERSKIEIFQRELPLCLDLVTQAIEKYKQKLSCHTSECANGQSDCSEQTICDEGPLFEEFMPIKESCSSAQQKVDDDGDEIKSPKNDNDKSCSGKKSDWLRSAQLWNQSPNPPINEENQSYQSKKVKAVEVKRNGGAFKPFKKENASSDNTGAAASVCSTVVEKAAGGGCSTAATKKEEARKVRRCWSPELHKRFLNALQQLGGSHVATPKQIRELMKVDGLTNDEVKSHLQKYRLHTRRPTPAIHSNTNAQAPQFVLVGGVFYSPAASSSALAATASTTQPTTSSGSLMVKSQPVSLESESI